MSRLSIITREKMANALVSHKMKDRADFLCRESVRLFNAVLDGLYDEPTRKAMASLTRRHPKAFARDNRISVNAGGYRANLGSVSFGLRGVRWSPNAAHRPILDSEKRNDIAVPAALKDEVQAFAIAQKALIDEIGPSLDRALATLAQFSTGKRLAAEWPEALAIIGKLIPENDRSLPVVQLAAINAEFDLPPEERIAA